MEQFLKDLYQVLKPVIDLLVITVGPLLVGWVSLQVSGFLKLKNDSEKASFETALKNALHEAARNGVRMAAARAGISMGDLEKGFINSDTVDKVRDMAVDYVLAKNPEAVKKFDLPPGGVADIVLSKMRPPV